MSSGGFGDQSPQFGQGPFSGGPQGDAGFGQPQPGQAPPGQAPPGQAPPQYGQGAPQYGQAAGQYGQPAGQYGQPAGYGPPQFGQAAYGRAGRGTNSLAIAALCCGIGQILAGPLAGIPAVILGFMSLGQISRSGEDGRGMAITGLVLGIVGLMLTVLIIILIIAVANNVTSSSTVPAG
jgi:Domain of unknown function (DUF4190)